MARTYKWACPTCNWTIEASKTPVCRPCAEDGKTVEVVRMETTDAEHTIF